MWRLLIGVVVIILLIVTYRFFTIIPKTRYVTIWTRHIANIDKLLIFDQTDQNVAFRRPVTDVTNGAHGKTIDLEQGYRIKKIEIHPNSDSVEIMSNAAINGFDENYKMIWYIQIHEPSAIHKFDLKTSGKYL